MPAISLLRVVPNSKLKEREARSVDLPIDSTAMQGLAGHIERAWQAAQTAKRPIEDEMFRALRQRTGIYDPEELALIRQQGGSEIFMMLTSAKCRGAESWLREVLLPETDRPWGLKPTPMPDVPPPVRASIVQSVAEMAMAAGWDIDDSRIDQRLLKIKALALRRMKELAERVAARMETKIADQFEQGGWDEALSGMIYDLVTFPTSFMKGPILRQAKLLRWQAGPNGQWFPVATKGLRVQWQRRSPFDIYPAPGMRDLRYGNLIDRYRFTREELNELIGVPGYSDDQLKKILERYGDRGYRSAMVNDMERARLEKRENEEYDPEGNIEALNFWGSVSGHMLLDWGFKNKVDVGRIVPTKEYQIEAWKTAGYVFKARVNPDPLGERPYTKACFEDIPDSIWGTSLCFVMRDCARMCNASARAISNNAAIASGPQVEVYVDRLAEGERASKPYPWKLWQMISDQSGVNQRALQFHQPQSNVQELLLIYSHFDRVADNVTGFPSYTYGDSRVGGAGRTSSGLAQLMGNVGKGVRRVVSAVDRGHIRPHVTRIYNYNMQHDPDASIKMDLVAVAKGTAALLTKDIARMRQQEILQATLNPLDAQIIGVDGRAEMLREVLKTSDFDSDKIIPDGLDLELAKAAMPPPHELLGKTGQNAAGPPAGGMTPGGGTPDAPDTTDVAGQPAQGTDVRSAMVPGYADGGAIKRVRMRRSVDADGNATVDLEPLE